MRMDPDTDRLTVFYFLHGLAYDAQNQLWIELTS